MKIFYKKSTAIAFTVAILVLVLLLCMLLVNLTQIASIRSKVEEYKILIEQAKTDAKAKEELLAKKNDVESVIKWAKDHNYISQDDISWIQENL